MAPDPQPTSRMRGPPWAPRAQGLRVTSSSTHPTSSYKAEGSGSVSGSPAPGVPAQSPSMSSPCENAEGWLNLMSAGAGGRSLYLHTNSPAVNSSMVDDNPSQQARGQ